MERTVVELYEDIAFRLVMVDEIDTVDIAGVRTFLQEFEDRTGSYPCFPEAVAALNASLDAIESGDARSGHDERVLEILEVLRAALQEIDGLAEDDEITVSPPLVERFRTIFSDIDDAPAAAPDASSEPESDLSELADTVTSDMFQLFASEADQKLLDGQDVILELESHFDREKVNHVFRVFHTLKGECGFINLEKIGALTHTVESLLDAVKNDTVPYSAEITDVLLRSIDEIRTLIDLLRQNDLASYIRHETVALTEELAGIVHRDYPPLGQILYEKKKVSQQDINEAITLQRQSNFEGKIGTIIVDEGKASSEDVEEALKIQDRIKRRNAPRERDSIISVRASQVNLLSDLIQELWIAENQIEHESIRQIQKITSQIQHIAMGLRTIRVQQLYIKLRRVARDLDQRLGKRVRVLFEGHELEIDRNLVESLEEVMMHFLRNAYDHGIESPAERREAGKPDQGTVIVAAERKGNRIEIVVRDDGRGLDRHALVRRATERGLIGAAEAALLPDSKVFELILSPGFSTAETVSDISGRGMGMDIIRTVVDEYQGRLGIESEFGRYTQFKLSFPLNTAIVDGLVVESRGVPFIVPIAEVVGCTQLEDEHVHSVNNGMTVLKARDELIPLVNLGDALRVEPSDDDGRASFASNRSAAIIVRYEHRNIALAVDRIIEKKEVVIKPLGKKFGNLKGISSGTVFSGGTVGYILDIDDLIAADAHRLFEPLPVDTWERNDGT